MTKNAIHISKAISYALRHNPTEFGLTLDSEGWVEISMLLSALHAARIDTSREQIEHIINESDKKRFEINGSRIRATYGHSFEKKIEYVPQEPPAILFHGTSRKAMERIIWEGLKSMSRQYVHLSSDVETAQKVGERHDRSPVILMVDACKMHNEGFKFYHTGNDTTWLCERVPFKYICPPPINEVLR